MTGQDGKHTISFYYGSSLECSSHNCKDTKKYPLTVLRTISQDNQPSVIRKQVLYMADRKQ